MTGQAPKPSVDRLCKRFAAVFGPPKTIDPEQLIREIGKALSAHSDEFIDQAGTEIIKTRRIHAWPTPAEIIQAGDRVAEARSESTSAARSSLLDEARDKAMRFVCGSKRDARGHWVPATGSWDPRWKDHETVRLADAEGWSRELRGACVAIAARKIRAGQPPRALEDVLPEPLWQEEARKQAARYRSAEAWREQVSRDHGSVDAFLRRKRPSPVAGGSPIAADVRKVMSDVSRRMSGERE